MYWRKWQISRQSYHFDAVTPAQSFNFGRRLPPAQRRYSTESGQSDLAVQKNCFRRQTHLAEACIWLSRQAAREVWYHCAMHASVKRFLAYLLLLLLPLQSLAAVAVLVCHAEMTHTIMVEHAIEDCHGTSIVQPAKSDAWAPNTKPHPENPLASHSSPCSMSSSCLTLASIAVLPDHRLLLIDLSIQSLALPTNSTFLISQKFQSAHLGSSARNSRRDCVDNKCDATWFHER